MSAILPYVITPLQHIFSAVMGGRKWPEIWKQEEVSVIPKTSRPESFDQLRNISCTSFFSKALEGLMLRKLHDEIYLSPSQYGGTKGCGTAHLLCELSTRIMEGLDTPGNVVAALSIDFNKAFNRMCHEACLRALKYKGASPLTLAIVAGFLSDRSMRIKINGAFSTPKNLNGGAPQGTRSGNYFFLVTIDDLENPEFETIHGLRSGMESPPVNGDAAPLQQPEDGSGSEEDDDDDILGLRQLAERVLETSADLSSSFSMNCQRMPRSQRRAELDTTVEESPRWPRWKTAGFLGLQSVTRKPWAGKYVDDFTAVEVIDFGMTAGHLSTGKEKRIIHAEELQKLYDTVKKNAESIGMVVHPQKTQLLCLHTAQHYDLSAIIFDGDHVIKSTDSLRVLGMSFSCTPGFKLNTKCLRKKFSAKMWDFTRLKRAGIGETVLTKAYSIYLRPIIEYACPAYAGSLTGEEKESLERCQRTALKTIFGFDKSYRSLLEETQLERLEDRRESLTKGFALKAYTNPRFSNEWFPSKQGHEHDTRLKQPLGTKRFNCYRFRNAPIPTMTRMLNEEDDLPPRPEE